MPEPLPEPLPGAHLRAAITDAVPPEGIAISDGDLWPSCWSDDGELYAANGDSSGFTGSFSDIVMNRVNEDPGSLDGVTLASGDDLGQVWSGEG